MRLRIAIGAAGGLLALFGAFRILTQVPGSDILVLLGWLVAAVILHDGILSPIIAGVGAVVARVVPPRARRVVQPALVIGALITVVALPLIDREDSQPASKAILRQDYGSNLAVLLAAVAAAAVLAYVTIVVTDRRLRGPRMDAVTTS